MPRALFGRSPAFAAVGLGGFLVQLAALHELTSGLGLPVLPASLAAVEVALLHNFAWHERWTWADRSSADPAGWPRRLGRFHAGNGLVSLAGNAAITTVLVVSAGIPPLVASALAVAACTVLNYLAADRLVFQAGASAQAEV